MITGLGFGLEDTGLGLGLGLEENWPWPRRCCPRTRPWVIAKIKQLMQQIKLVIQKYSVCSLISSRYCICTLHLFVSVLYVF